MKKVFKVFAMSLLCILLVFNCTKITSEAKSCKHSFKNDVCKKCSYVRVHEFEESILFYTAKDEVPVWSEPTKNSELVKEIPDKNTMVDLEGVLRNQYGNIWLKVDGKGYIYIENLYLNFESLVACSWQEIYALEGEAAIAEFYNQVSPNGSADYKRWLDPSSKGIIYKVSIKDELYDMTAEELGNINYGYLGKMVGFTDDVLLYAGGALNQFGKLNSRTWNSAYQKALKDCSICGSFLCDQIEKVCAVGKTPLYIMTDIVEECSSSYCDTKEDAEDVMRGIEYYKNGEFE